jgi:hypothetical protein
MEEKVSRDAVNRNGYLRKHQEEFIKSYYQAHPDRSIKVARNNYDFVLMEKNPISVSPQKKNTTYGLNSSLKRPTSSKP